MQAHTSRVWPIGLIAVLALLGPVTAHGAERQRLHIAVGRAEVVPYSEDVRTVAIAEPKIANAAVGSARTGVGSLLTAWKALEGNGSLRVLAHPTLVARSGEKASFHAGGEFPIPIASSQGTAGGGVTVTIEWKAFGVRVDFTPTVEEDSTITLVVDSEVSQLDFNNALTLSGFNVPSVIVRRTATTVSLRNG